MQELAGGTPKTRCESIEFRPLLVGHFSREKKSMRPLRPFLIATAATFTLGAWFIFWALSESLLNMARCGNEYSLLSTATECRRPVLLEILGFVLLGFSFLLLFVAWRRFRSLRRADPKLGQGGKGVPSALFHNARECRKAI